MSLANDAIDAAVATPADSLRCVGLRAAVAERDENVEDDVFEEAIVALDEPAENLIGERVSNLPKSRPTRLD